MKEHLNVFAPTFIETLEILVFSAAEDPTYENRIGIINTAASLML